jgi:hypothetical protein
MLVEERGERRKVREEEEMEDGNLNGVIVRARAQPTVSRKILSSRDNLERAQA